MKDYDPALDNVHRAYRVGFPLPGLRNMLQRGEKWRQPASESSTSPVPLGVAPIKGQASLEVRGKE